MNQRPVVFLCPSDPSDPDGRKTCQEWIDYLELNVSVDEFIWRVQSAQRTPEFLAQRKALEDEARRRGLSVLDITLECIADDKPLPGRPPLS